MTHIQFRLPYEPLLQLLIVVYLNLNQSGICNCIIVSYRIFSLYYLVATIEALQTILNGIPSEYVWVLFQDVDYFFQIGLSFNVDIRKWKSESCYSPMFHEVTQQLSISNPIAIW